MSKPDRFQSAKQRLRRGKEHVKRLKKRLETYFKKEPHTTIAELDADGVTQLHKIKLKKPLSQSCNDSAIEALEALRSALDQAGYAAAVAAGHTNPKRTAFPISSDVAELDNLITGRGVCKDIPDEIVALFRSFNPYKGGNDPLFVLNKLRNKTHTTLTPIGFIAGEMKFSNFTGQGPFDLLAPKWDREKQELIVARIGPAGHVQYNAQVRFYVTFDDPDLFDGTVAVDALELAANEITKIIRATESECKALGFNA